MGGSRKKWDGWNTGPKLDEARVIAPEVAGPTRAKKDRRRWCKGKIGVEHAWEIKISKWAIQHRLRWANASSEHSSCGWRADHDRINTKQGRLWLPNGEWHWNCVHNHVCANCGKILEHFSGIGKECPDRTPRDESARCDCWSCRTRPGHHIDKG
jgi:hypothetical protein